MSDVFNLDGKDWAEIQAAKELASAKIVANQKAIAVMKIMLDELQHVRHSCCYCKHGSENPIEYCKLFKVEVPEEHQYDNDCDSWRYEDAIPF